MKLPPTEQVGTTKISWQGVGTRLRSGWAILLYIQMKHPDLSLPVQALQTGAMTQAQAGKGYNVDDVMAELVRYEMKPDTLTKEIVDTVSTISQIVGKSTRTLLRMLSLIDLSDYIRAAISEGTLPVSQGYLFAANLDSWTRDHVSRV